MFGVGDPNRVTTTNNGIEDRDSDAHQRFISCDICGQPFRNANALRQHKVQHPTIVEKKAADVTTEDFLADFGSVIMSVGLRARAGRKRWSIATSECVLIVPRDKMMRVINQYKGA